MGSIAWNGAGEKRKLSFYGTFPVSVCFFDCLLNKTPFCAIISLMADGKEDLREKNKEDSPAPERYDEWRVFQGREDAEMLREKSQGWKRRKDWSEKHDRWEDD